MSDKLVTENLDQEMSRLRKQGVSLPKNPDKARQEAENIKRSVQNRTLMGSMRRTASNVQLALPKIREPLSSLRDKNIPFDYTDPDELKDIRRWARLFYATHDLVPLLVDIYAKFPTTGLSFQCKDQEVADFYEQMFFDELDYGTFLQDIGREFFIAGEVTTLAHFDERLGVWSSEEILNPDQIIVSRSLFSREEEVLLDVTDLVEGLRDQSDSDLSQGERLRKAHELKMLQKYYPEFIQAADREEGIPLDDSLVSRMTNKVSYWDKRGTPHMLRSFRTLMMEESLNAAQDAIADRLYSPFLLAKLGVPNLGDGEPWIPSMEEIDGARDDLQTALAADFRLMVHNFGIDVQSVFGRESVPRFDNDYARIDEKLMQAWGIGKSLISGGSGGPYASSAINREFVTQMMTSFQLMVKRHMKKRMQVIAEAQGHYDYEVSGGVRKPLFNEVLREDPVTGEEVVVKEPKLLIPEVEFQAINLRDEAQERQFLQQLKSMGVPISDDSLSVNIPIEFEEELEKSASEQVDKYKAQAEAMVRARKTLEEAGLPIPAELNQFFLASAMSTMQIKQMEEGKQPTGLDQEPLVPSPQDPESIDVPPELPVDDSGMNRPPESDEMRTSSKPIRVSELLHDPEFIDKYNLSPDVAEIVEMYESYLNNEPYDKELFERLDEAVYQYNADGGAPEWD